MKISWLGSLSGGAYIDLTKLNASSVVYSFGIATEISLDRAIIEHTRAQVWGYDPDPRSTQWLQALERWVPPEFHFKEVALGTKSGRFTFHTTDIECMTGSLSRSVGTGENIQVQAMTLSELMASNGHEVVDYLKMDIEGTEYEVLDAWLSEYGLLPVRQLWVEFHPGGTNKTQKNTNALIRNLEKIGMVPGFRNYLRCPNNILLANKELFS